MSAISSLAAEQALIAVMLKGEATWPDIAGLSLSPGDFANDAHVVIAQTAKTLADMGRPTDLPTIHFALAEAGRLEDVGPDYLGKLGSGVGVAANMPSYAAAIRKASAHRRAVDAINRGDTEAAAECLAKIAQQRHGTLAGATLIDAHRVCPEPIAWVWPGWLARGKVHILAGSPGTGKTTAALAMVATITTGGRWPDGAWAEPGECVIWSGEDDPKDTLVPRLIAAGADLRKVRFVTSMTDERGPRAFDPATDLDALNDAISDRPPALLIVDPVVSAVGGDSHKNAEVRRALQPLVDLASTRRCVVLGITHLTKGTQGRDPTERVTGSLAFGALARVVLIAAKLPDEEGGGRILARAKSNIGPDGGGFGYDLNLCDLDGYPGLSATRVLWGETLTGTARELLERAESMADPEEHGALADAKGFLWAMLADGPMTAKKIQAEARDAGHTWATVRRAKDALGVESTKDGTGPWKWSLPEGAHEDAQQENMSALSTFEDAQPLSNMSAFSCGKGSREDAHPKTPDAQLSTFDGNMSTFPETQQPREDAQDAQPMSAFKDAQDAHQKVLSTFPGHEHLRPDADGMVEVDL